MWKIKLSKYRNAAPKFPKKEEWITDFSAMKLLHSCGNRIAAGLNYMAFNTDVAGGKTLAILPLEARGRQATGIKQLTTIHAHADYVSDFAFSPFNGYLLATGSQDCTVNIWNLPAVLEESIENPSLTLTHESRRVENVLWHPSADGILAVTSMKTVKIFNVATQQALYALNPHTDQIQSITWRGDGSILATSCKDKTLRVIDPRSNTVAQEAPGHANMNDSRIMWLGNSDRVVTTGYDQMRQREVSLRDVRNLGTTLSTKTVDTSTGVLMPLYDADTGMLFLAGVGDTSLRYMEATDTEIIENAMDTVEQVKGLALVPKTAVDVMQCEVDRLMLLSKNAIIPVSYHVPRKSYIDFHEDLYPDTFVNKPAMTAEEWCAGQNKMRAKMSLNPGVHAVHLSASTGSTGAGTSHGAYRQEASLPVASGHVPAEPVPTIIVSAEPESVPQEPVASEPVPAEPVSAEPASVESVPSEPVSAEPAAAEPEPASVPVHADSPEKEEHAMKPSDLLREKKPRAFSGVRQSKFRHLKGTPVHKSQHIENLRNVAQNMPGESDMFQANPKFCGVPLGGPGGLIAVLKMDDVGRLPDTGVPAVQNGSKVADFVWDPFNDHRLVVACDDAQIRVWRIPEEGLTGTFTEPETSLLGHTEKVYFARFHPLASDILASASYDMTVRIWSLESEEELIQLSGHTDSVFCFAWSPDGQRCATVSRDGKVRIYDPRTSVEPVCEGQGPEGTRGARCVWVCGGKFLVVTGFDRMSGRQVHVYDADRLGHRLHCVDLDTSPAILIPHYDEDSATLFVTGRGDMTVRAFEVSEDYPHLFPLSDYKADGLHQALAFLPKNVCDVRQVEFAKALRLTKDSIEPIAFTVPRVKREFFQDDIYPDTRVTWQVAMTAQEWMAGANNVQPAISLRPADMTALSEAPSAQPKAKKYETFQEYQQHYKTDDEKKEELLSAMEDKLGERDGPLPQDLAEGVDSDEWSD